MTVRHERVPAQLMADYQAAGTENMNAAADHVDAVRQPGLVLSNGIMSWMANWKRNGWRTKQGQPVKNEDLWRELDAAVARHDAVVWHWVKGHAGHVENERADRLAARGQREALEAAGLPVSPLPEPRRQAAARTTVTADGLGAGPRRRSASPARSTPDRPASATSMTPRFSAAPGGGRCRTHEHVRTTVETLDL